MRHTIPYNPTIGKATKIGAVQYYYACLSELDNKGLCTNLENDNLYFWKLNVLELVWQVVSPILMSLGL